MHSAGGMNELEKYTDQAIELVIEYTPKFLLALIVLVVGLWIVNRLVALISRVMKARRVDPTLGPFVTSLAAWTLKAILLISVASMVGIETTSFVAVLGAAGLAVGLALQGTLQNFAGGALLLLFRPYEVGHLIQAQGHLGVVREIQIFTTHLVTLDNKRAIIPNGALSNGDIINYTVENKLRVDLVVGVAYDSDLKAAKAILHEVLSNHDKVLSEPAPFVGVLELADSSVNLAVRPYARPEHYWDVYFDVYEQAKAALDAANITIPFPQRDVHLYKHDADAAG